MRDNWYDRPGHAPDSEPASDSQQQISPGKVTLTSRIIPSPLRPVQMRAETSAPAVTTWHADPMMTDAAVRGTPAPGGDHAGVTVMRKGEGTLESARVSTALDTATQNSSGSPMAPAVQRSMESSFGQSFDGVRVHTDAPAARAAQDLNARAFTVNRDVYFNRNEYAPSSGEGKRLLAHELAHVAQGGAVAARGSGAGPTVSSPSDAAEVAADRAADAVVSGQPVPALGGAPASVVHRDGLDDVRETAEGNWIGSVDNAEALRRIEALSADEKARLRDDHATMRRLASSFNAAEMLRLFSMVHFDLRWKIYWLEIGSDLSGLSRQQWQWILGYATPQDMESLRGYPDGYRLVMQNCPADFLPAWDKLQGLENGTWSGQPVDVRNAVNQLNPQQKETVRGDQAKMLVIVQNAGTPAEKFRTLQYLETPVKWVVYWMNRVNEVPQLTDQEWAQMLAEGGKQEFDELVGWADMWQLALANCPASVLQVVRQQQADPSTTTTSLDDPVQIGTLLASLGPAGFLAQVTQTEPDIAANYAKIKAAGKVNEVLDGLNVGPKLGARTAENLKKWFFQGGETTVATLEKMCTVRFRINFGGTGSKDHTTNPNGTPTGRNIQPWTKTGLEMAWTVMERLPPAQIEQNEEFLHLIRNSAAGNGNAYYSNGSSGGDGRVSQGDVVMGYGSDGSPATGTAAGTGLYRTTDATAQVYAANGVTMPLFNATLRHEIGHAVDRQLGVMDNWMHQNVAGNWIQYGSYSEFVDAIIAASGGMDAHGYPDNAKYRQAMINAVTKTTSFSTELTALGLTPPAAPGTGPIATVWQPANWTGNGNGPWYNAGNFVPQGGRHFQRSYGGPSSLNSYLAAQRAARLVTQYQWRAPGEWFAEVYQVYYAEQENDPRAPVGGLLRSKDPEAASMMSNIVDRGFSPQSMRGGGTVNAPGTGGSP